MYTSAMEQGLIRTQFPIVEETQLEIASVDAFRDEVIDRKKRRMDFWMGSMDDEEEKMSDRLRASELAAKADGDFIERKELNLVSSYREMIMTKAGNLEELAPPVDQLLLEMDAGESSDIDEAVAEEDEVEYAVYD